MAKGKEKMLTVREAAERIGASAISVRIWASRGRFAGAKKEASPVGEFWMIPETALIGFELSKPGPKPGSKSRKRKTQGN